MHEHYIALDWSKENMAIARMTSVKNTFKVIDVPSSLYDLKSYLDRLKGKKILTFEETNTSQWLYTELLSHVDDILVCDPYRNKLLSEGAKTDKIDAKKLCHLLKAGLLKPVFHSGDEFIKMRKIVSGYEDVVQAGVRVKNQRSALFRSIGKDKKEKDLNETMESFVLEGIDRSIEAYELEKKRYEKEFSKLTKEYKILRDLQSIPGIGLINSIKIAAIVVDPKRFKSKISFLNYCGLVNLQSQSGGRNYGVRRPFHYNRTLKSVFKTATLATTQKSNDNIFKDYYHYLIEKKNYSVFNARHATSRKIAVVTYGVMKSKKKFNGGNSLLKNKSDL